jgi:hypothetical protein
MIVIFMKMTCSRSVVFPGYFSFLHQKTGRHDITKILFKVLLNTITQPQMNSELIALGRCSMAECAPHVQMNVKDGRVSKRKKAATAT